MTQHFFDSERSISQPFHGSQNCHGKWARLVLLLLLPLLPTLAACGDPVNAVREARLEPDPTRTVAEALEAYPYFKKVTWTSTKDKDGKIFVQAECDIDVAASCPDVSPQSLALANRDVNRDYLVAQYVVAGWPRQVRPQYAIHITQCANGNLLSVADPKYLRAIYKGERVRFFCLEGLNCPPASKSNGQGSGPNGQGDGATGKGNETAIRPPAPGANLPPGQ